MKQSHFESRWAPFWKQFDQRLVEREHGIKNAWQEFPADYRHLCQQLSLAQTRCYSLSLIERLHALAYRGHKLLYGHHRSRWFDVAAFFLRDFPIAVRSNRGSLSLALLAFLLPALVLGIWIYLSPDFIYHILPTAEVANFEKMYGHKAALLGRLRGYNTNIMMFGHYIRNNIGIAFRTFGSGIFAGVGSLFVLWFNGVQLGAVAGYLTQRGFGGNFWSFISGHSAFELSAIVLAGQAGLIMGAALIAPGNLTRADSFRTRGKVAAHIIGGATVMLLIAAFIEAFWSSSSALPVALKYLAAGLWWLGVVGYFTFTGRRYQALQFSQDVTPSSPGQQHAT